MGSEIITLFSYRVRCSLVALLALGDREVVNKGLRLRDLCDICGLNHVRMMDLLMTLADKGFITMSSYVHRDNFRLDERCKDFPLYRLVTAVDARLRIGDHSANDPVPLANKNFNMVARTETDINKLLAHVLKMVPIRYFFLNDPTFMGDFPGLGEFMNRQQAANGFK